MSPDGSYAPASSAAPAPPYPRPDPGAHPAVAAVQGAAVAFLSLIPRPDLRRPRSPRCGLGTRRRRCRGPPPGCKCRGAAAAEGLGPPAAAGPGTASTPQQVHGPRYE
ncbi:hypothetical protein PVAP13_3KG560300 [Panicum virgatum]|uniref:Uncharacterized protein n=1 Tax=Panicum virgatum TaxID=38727 RepID=A0A8T0VDU5_PANVG|nr:hypothetical protein PVAP13_3KG560300 [Panicum virgatum]